jgi:hypothetical protein
MVIQRPGLVWLLLLVALLLWRANVPDLTIHPAGLPSRQPPHGLVAGALGHAWHVWEDFWTDVRDRIHNRRVRRAARTREATSGRVANGEAILAPLVPPRHQSDAE